MAVTLLAGAETSVQNTDNNPRGIDANVYLLEPSAAPLTALMSAMGSKPADNPKVEWNENEAMPRITTISASAASGATTYSVTADIFRVGDVIRFTSLGFGLLLTATGAGSVTGTILGTSVSGASANEIYLVSNANAEGATLREIKFPQINPIFNYDQIVRTPVGLTETELGTLHYAGDERARLRKEAGIEHARAIEQNAFFGFRSISSVTRTAGGIASYITTNVTADTGGLTEVEWQSFLKTGFRYGSDNKVAFCSPQSISTIEGFARGRMEVVNDAATKFGITMKRYISGQGTVDLVMHRDWNDSAVYGGYVFLVDMNAVFDRPLRNVGQTRLLPDRHAPDYDGVKDEYRSETCIQVIHERRHAVLTGVAAGSN